MRNLTVFCALLLIQATLGSGLRGDENAEIAALEGEEVKMIRDAMRPGKPVVEVHISRQVTKADLEHLSKLNHLKSLAIRNWRTESVGFRYLSTLEKLESLDLSTCPLEGKPLRLAGLCNLRKLNLNNTGVRDQDLKGLSELKNLEYLDLSNTEVTDTTLKMLAGMSRLQTLKLSKTEVDNGGLKELMGLTTIQELDVADTVVGDSGLESLVVLKHLRVLQLGGPTVTDKGLKSLASLDNIEELGLAGTAITDAGLKELYRLRRLRRLVLCSVNGVTRKGIDGLRKKLAKCEIVSPLGERAVSRINHTRNRQPIQARRSFRYR